MDISVLVVNYNTADWVGRCVESVLRQQDADFELIVVDNHSADESLSVLRAFGDRIRLIEHPENIGFGRANNLAAREATGRHLFLLNPDAELTDPHALARITDAMDAHSDWGLAGTRVIQGREGRTASLHKTYPGEKTLGGRFRDLPGDIAWLIGASMVIPKAVFEEIGGFDEDFFLYGEDADICLRVRQRGYAIGCLEDVPVFHADGASEVAADPYDYTVRRRKARLLFYRKHYAPDEVVRVVRDDLERVRRRLWWDRLRRAASLGLLNADNLAKWSAIRDVCERFLEDEAEAGEPRDAGANEPR